MPSEILTEAQKKLARVVQQLKEEIALLRAGRASPALLADLTLSAYGTELTLREVATINLAGPQLLVVSPWDKQLQDSILQAIREAGLGLQPLVDGEVIKVPVPSLSEERRRNLLKKANSLTEEARVKVRQIRQEQLKELNQSLNEKEFSEDDFFRLKEELQKMVEETNQRLEELRQQKEAELLG